MHLIRDWQGHANEPPRLAPICPENTDNLQGSPLNGLHFNLLFRLLRPGCLRARYGEHALFEAGIDFVGVNALGYSEVTLKRAEMPLA